MHRKYYLHLLFDLHYILATVGVAAVAKKGITFSKTYCSTSSEELTIYDWQDDESVNEQAGDNCANKCSQTLESCCIILGDQYLFSSY